MDVSESTKRIQEDAVTPKECATTSFVSHHAFHYKAIHHLLLFLLRSSSLFDHQQQITIQLIANSSSFCSLTFSSSKRPKPLYLSSSSYGSVSSSKCKAYEAADESIIIDDDAVAKAEAETGAQRLKISNYLAHWWGLNVVFNIYKKKVLNSFPYPWITSTLSLAVGSLIMFFSWATKIAQPPQTDFDFWKSLFLVAHAHTIGHVAATISMSKFVVSFNHIIKNGEPAFTVLVSSLLLGESFPLPVYLSLLPIIGGCALAAVTELNFNMICRFP